MAIDELTPLSAALAGDHDAFQRLVEPYQRELLVHCYRFFGALEDAEDMLQETWLRAWRGLNSYAGRASLRAWLYKIATNVCLDALDRRRARTLPNMSAPLQYRCSGFQKNGMTFPYVVAGDHADEFRRGWKIDLAT